MLLEDGDALPRLEQVLFHHCLVVGLNQSNNIEGMILGVDRLEKVLKAFSQLCVCARLLWVERHTRRTVVDDVVELAVAEVADGDLLRLALLHVADADDALGRLTARLRVDDLLLLLAVGLLLLLQFDRVLELVAARLKLLLLHQGRLVDVDE